MYAHCVGYRVVDVVLLPAYPHPPCCESARTAMATTAISLFSGAATSAVRKLRCPKCGSVRKSGRLSCCARGGAWFQKCGDVADTNVGYTWAEGFRACDYGFTSTRWFMIEAPLQARHDRIIVQPINATEQRNDTRKDNDDIHPSDNLSAGETADGEDRIELAKTAAFTSLLLIICTCRYHFNIPKYTS